MTDYYSNLLLDAAKSNNLEDVQIAWMRSENRYETDFLGHNALTLSILFNNLEVLKYLVDKGFNLNLVNRVAQRYVELSPRRQYHYLKEYNNDSFLGATSLICATKNRNFEIIQYLVENGACVNLKDSEGHIALYYAIRKRCDKNLIEYLIRNRSNIESTVQQLDEDAKYYKDFSVYWKKLRQELQL